MHARFFSRLSCLSYIALIAFAPALRAKPITPASIAAPVAPMGLMRTSTPAPTSTTTTSSNAAQFDTIPAPLPPNVTSLGYEAASTAEFGDLVKLAGTTHIIDSVTVTMSSQALRSDFPGSAAAGYTVPMTLKLYAVDRSTGVAQPGTVLATVANSFVIPWRPEPDPTAPASPSRPWKASDGNYYTGLACNITFNLPAIAGGLPAEVIYGVAFNTQHAGTAPTGVNGPYNSLNIGLSDVAPAVGTDVEPDAVMWRTSVAAYYADGGAGGVNTFRRDTGWTPYKPTVRFNSGSIYSSLQAVAAQLQGLSTTDRKLADALSDARCLVDLALARALWEDNNHVRCLWGVLEFELLSDAADELDTLADSRATIALQALAAERALLDIASALANGAVNQAVANGCNARQLAKARDALSDAQTWSTKSRYDKAIESYGDAWWQANLAM